MRYDDASLSGSLQASADGPDARDDTDALAGGARGPATGNTISGAGTITGSAGADLAQGGHITAVEGAGGRDGSFSGGELRVAGEHGTLSISADGDYRYVPRAGTPENVQDVFTYTLADGSGGTDQARLIIEIGKTPAQMQANAERIVPGPDGVVLLPAGVDLSDIRVVGRDLVVMLPDGQQLVIVDGAVFVPQLVINNVEVPATNLAALLIDSEPQPAAGNPQSSGGNFAVPVAPLAPGFALGDLLPPTELGYTPPDFRDPGFALKDEDNDRDVEVGENAVVQLDDDALAGGNPGGIGDDPDSANASGFLSGSGGDGPLTFDLLTSGAPTGFSYEDGPDGSVLVRQGGTLVLTITVDPATGEYSVTQNAPILHPAGGDENNVVFTISYTVTDDDGDSRTGALTVNVDDDTPIIDVAAAADDGVVLVTDDADTIGSHSDTATSSANFGGVFSLNFSPGADGTDSAPVLSYALGTAGGASGLTSHGAVINLYLVNGVVVGSTAGTAAEVTAGNTIFDVSVDAAGTVTLTQFSQIDHSNADPSPTGAPFDDQLIALVDSAITLSATASYTDRDGDPASDSATVGIGANLQFSDDGPLLRDIRATSGVMVDETWAGSPSGFPISNTSESAMIRANAVFGVDGPAASNALSYSISINGGGTTPLVTSIGDYPITLVQNGPDQITGQFNDGTDVQTAFTVTLNADGTVTVVQNVPLEHLVDGPPGPAHNDPLSLTGLINGNVTATDFDGDTSSGTVDIGSRIVFRDDGPHAIIDHAQNGTLILLTQDAETVGAAFDTASLDFSGVVRAGGDPGADGGQVLPLSYALGTVGGASGLTQGGVTINLFLVGGVVVGSTATSAATVDASNTVFDVSVSPAGVVTLNQFSQIDHPAPSASNPDPLPNPAFDAQIVSMADELITLSVTVTVVDNDGDTDSKTLDLEIGANLQFADDGPLLSEVKATSGVSVDETWAGSPAGFPISNTSESAMIRSDSLFGADGPAASTALSYSISINGGGTTPLLTAIGDHPVTLVQNGPNEIIGQFSDGSGIHTAFTVTMNADGTVTLVQHVPLEHLVDGPPGPAHNDPLSLAGLINGNVTATDFDGDTASGSTDIGSRIVFRDDGPHAISDHAQNGTLLLVTQDGETVGAAFDTASIDFSNIVRAGGNAGADGGQVLPLSYALGTVGGASGLTQDGAAINLFLVGGLVVGSTATSADAITADNRVFDVSTTQTGVVTLTQYSQIDHPAPQDGNPDPRPNPPFDAQIVSMADELIALNATVIVIDNDGDTDSKTLALEIGANLQFADDGPQVTSTASVASSVTLDETDGSSPLSSGAPISVTSDAAVIAAGVDYGADGQGPAPVYGLSLLNGSAVGTSVASGLATATGNFPITLTLTNATTITGSYNDGSDKTAFVVTINPNGTLTVTQNVALEHGQDGPTAADHNDALTLVDASLQSLVNATVTYQDGDGDTVSNSVGVGGAITFLDDAGTLGTFGAVTVSNVAGAEGAGAFAYDQGADGHGSFAITGPALAGVNYTTVQNADGAFLTATTDPDGSGGNPPVTLFTLQVNTEGTYDFTLVTPQAGSTESVSLKGLTPGGPTPFVQTPDGRVEFTGSGNGVNSSTPGFGISNQFVGNGESFTVEFHSTGQAGNQASNENLNLVSSAVLKNDMINGSLTIKVTFHNDFTGETEIQTIPVTGSSTVLDPATLGQFNWVEIEGVGGSGQGVRFTTLDYTKTILPPDLDLQFQVQATDQDGDMTSTQTLSVTVDSTPPSSLAGLRTFESQSSTTTNATVFAAVAAAAGLAALPAAAEPLKSDDGQASLVTDSHGIENAFVGRVAVDARDAEDTSALAGQDTPGGPDEGRHESASSRPTHEDSARTASLDDGGAGDDRAPARADLADHADAPAHQAPAPAAEIAMPSAEALSALAGKADSVDGESAGKHDASVGKVLADALGGGHAGPDIDTLLAALPDGNAVNGGGNPATDGLASHQAAAVPGWDSGHFAGLSHGPAFMMEAAVLHHDAVQPA